MDRAVATAASWSCRSLAVAPDPRVDHSRGPTCMLSGITQPRRNEKQASVYLQENEAVSSVCKLLLRSGGMF